MRVVRLDASETFTQERSNERGIEEPDRASPARPEARPPSDRLFFLAHKQPDGTYSITLTDEGIQTFETALGIADDLGGKTRISPFSTIADIMERTATREELSQLLRRGSTTLLLRIRRSVLRRQLRGSEKPSGWQRTIGHLGKAAIVGAIGVWTLRQFGTAIQDIEDIPGILANIPSDILNLHPTSAFQEVGARISDAGNHVLIGVLGALLTYVAAKVIRPFGRIYRRDQLIPGERLALRLVNWALRRADGELNR